MKTSIAILGLFAVTFAWAAPKPIVSIEAFEARTGSNVTQTQAEAFRDRVLDLIHNSNKFEVVERERLATLLKEMQLVDAAMTEGDAPESNRLKAASYTLYGSILPWRVKEEKANGAPFAKATFEAQIRYSDGESGKILAVKTLKGEATKGSIAAQEGAILREEALAAAQEVAAIMVVNALLDVTNPIKVAAVNTRYVTVALAAEQTYEGEQFEVYELGEPITDPDTGEELGAEEELIGIIEVVRPGAKLTRCKPCDDTTTADYDRGMLLRRIPQKAKQNRQNKKNKNALRMMR